MKTILVTGAGGLLGSVLVPLLAREHRVVALARTATAPESPNIAPLSADLSQPLDTAILPDRIDALVYLAQSPRFRDFPGGAEDVRRVNTDQPLVLIEEARRRGATSFVYASTGSVYAPAHEPLREDGPAPAEGFYAGSKMAAELLLRPYGELMNVSLLRFFFIYGAGQKRDMLLPRLVDSVRSGRSVTLQGEQGLRLQPLHVDDAAAAVRAAVDLQGSHTINVAGPEVLSLRGVCEAAGRAVGRAPSFTVSAASGATDLIADTARMTDLLGPPSVRFEAGLADIL